MTVALSDAARSVWAKSDREHGADQTGWLPLHRHLDDTAAVAEKLWDDWLPDSTKRIILGQLPGGAADGRRVLSWLAGIHDVGKATPAFAIQVPDLATRMQEQGLDMPATLLDRSLAPHAMAGQLILTRWLESRHGWSRERATPFAVVVGGHHGMPPDHMQLVRASKHPELLGVGIWERVQNEFLDRAEQRFGLSNVLASWDGNQLPMTSRALLTGAVIVADWMASNTELFPYDELGDQAVRTEQAWAQLRLPTPWQAAGVDPLPHFSQRFGLPDGTLPRPLQTVAVNLATELADPGLMIIEAPMGEGKTEAALMVAEVFAAKTGAGGCFVALPTQATSNAMFTRVTKWLTRLPDKRGDGSPRSVTLAHGKANLNDQFRGLMRGRFREIGRDEPTNGEHSITSLVAPEWMAGRKRANLASFVIGTIDQILFSGLKTKHLVLRHLAMASKVVIIDEAHAYDVYMSSYLDRVLHWLGAYQVPTIVLSATLPSARRIAMITAYEQGKYPERGGRLGRRERLAQQNVPHPELIGDIGYPVLTASTSTGTAAIRLAEPAPRHTVIELERIDDELPALTRVLSKSLAQGGCAVVIRNTVKRVQETARELANSLPDTDIIVMHSRFLGSDRAVLENRLLRLFGPDGSAQRREQRFVVVASQVVEQSLDIDFDLLVTDLAPLDLVLQRMGRLHRHERGVDQSDRSPLLRRARCVITGVDWSRTPPEPVAGSRAVYEAHPLYRALAILNPLLDTGEPVTLPQDIAPFVQRAYNEERLGPDSWQLTLQAASAKFEHGADQRRSNAKAFLLDTFRTSSTLVGWLDAGVGNLSEDDPRGIAQVRDGHPGLEVLVVERDEDGGIQTPHWLNRHAERPVPTDDVLPPRLARIVATCNLQLPAVMCLPNNIDRVITDLEANCFSGWQQTYLLAGQLALVLDGDGRAQLADFELNYDPRYGLEYQRVE